MKILRIGGYVSALLLFSACVTHVPHRSSLDRGNGRCLNSETYLAARRAFFRMRPGDSLRRALRVRLLTYLGQQAKAEIASDNYAKAVERLREMTSLYTSREFQEESLSPELCEVARYVRKRGSERGDEARVLSALWILWRLDGANEKRFSREYRRVAQWGRAARAELPVIERFQDLLDVWEEHASLVPAPSVLRRVASYYFSRRKALLTMTGRAAANRSSSNERAVGFQDLNMARFILRRTPVDLAAVYLRQGDVQRAYRALRAYGPKSEAEQQFEYLLHLAASGESTASDAILTLSRLYIKDIGRMDVARGLCRKGRQLRPSDARFALCLARISAMEGKYADATAEYAEATRLANQELPIYDEALRVLQRLIETRAFESDPTHTRALAKEAEHILKERVRRWPKTPLPVKLEQFYFAIGTAEMSAGNTEVAKARFLASLEAHPNLPALLRLGLLSLNRGQIEEAINYYKRILKMAKQTEDIAPQIEGEALEKLGDALRMANDTAASRVRYEEAARFWSRASDQLKGEALAAAYVRRGVIADRLGNAQRSTEFFEQAMGYASADRSVYEQILSHLVTSEANAELAQEVYHRALRQVSLEPEWKVYFALWVQVIMGRSGSHVQQEVLGALAQLASTDAWWGRLASFGARKLPYRDLLTEAVERGEQTEAHFYEAARLMVEGNIREAVALFHRVLATDMVSYYEYSMAREFLSEHERLHRPARLEGARHR
ncbi:MAG: hypothetical protein H6715_00045 [Myxococcales bacterium]|nr:hypothetical protein [Myxococcales bacterium]MCB9707355.1 hypothetical protein [Myxococcales bacterium]